MKKALLIHGLLWIAFLGVLLTNFGFREYHENKRASFTRQLSNEFSRKLELSGIEVAPGRYLRNILDIKAVSPKPIDREIIIGCLADDFTLAAKPIGNEPNYIYIMPPDFIKELRVIIRNEEYVDGLFETKISYYISEQNVPHLNVTTPLFIIIILYSVFLRFEYGNEE